MAWHENSKRVTVRTLFRQGWSHSMIAKRTSVPQKPSKSFLRDLYTMRLAMLRRTEQTRHSPPTISNKSFSVSRPNPNGHYVSMNMIALRQHPAAPSCTIKIASLLPSKKASYHACSEETSCDICKISLGRRMFFILLRG